MWQVAGGHGYIDLELAIEDMMRHHEDGFTSWDLRSCRRFYWTVKTEVSRAKRKQELGRIQALTKCKLNQAICSSILS